MLDALTAEEDEALALLVRAHHDRMVRYGRRVCHDDFDVDDAIQEAFVQVARRPELVRAPGILGWLKTVVRNACHRLWRPFARERRALGERVELATVERDDALARWELVRAVHAAIATLDRPAREVIVMRDLEGLSGAETCRRLGIDTAAMKSRLHRARTALRAALR
ncbi:MAG: sigma-70 family RNA polymerase sigma factor, partial [Kofleriaceae bacterium]